MPRKNCLVKLSGDTINDEVLLWIKELSKKYFVVICCGGGTQINKAFVANNLPKRKFGPLGRETKSFKERQLARDVLEQNQVKIQDKLYKLGIYANVVTPVLEIGTVLCHVNGDQFVLTGYHGFAKIFVVTTPKRLKSKIQQFSLYKKIEVVAFKKR